MKFGQQKFLIGLLLIALPMLALFSILESPYLSQSLLKVSLRMLNFRTGVSISAAAWDLHPTTFSASISKVDFSKAGIFFRAEEIEVQLSPIDLIFGVANLRNLTVRGLSLKGKVPERWFDSDPNEPSPKPEELPDFFSQKLQKINRQLADSSLGFSELAIESANIDFSNFKAKDLNLRLIKQTRGQARVEVSLQSLEIPKKLAATPNLSLSLSLARDSRNRFVFLVRELSVGNELRNGESLVVSGRVPGTFSARLNLDLAYINKILENGEWTRSLHQPGLKGIMGGSTSVNFSDSKTWEVSLEDVVFSELVYDDYKLKRLELSMEYNSKTRLHLRKANFVLPASLTDPKDWRQSLSISQIQFKDGDLIEGSLQASELSLCSIMIATDVNECFAGFQINGPATFSGTLNPLKIAVKTDWSMSPALVYTEPEVPGKKAVAPLLKTNEAKLLASVVVFDKYLSVLDTQVVWGDSKLGLKGDIKYVPTRVELDLRSDRFELSHILNHFMDSPISGFAAVKAQILYDYSIANQPDRTRVFGALEVDKLSYAGQLIGQTNAPILYEKGDLNIGPASLASGGGTAILRGVLANRPDNKSKLEASATMRRYEVSINNSQDKNIVRGFYTGVVKIDGFLSETASQPGIRGRISGSLDSAQVLGIGLTRVDGTLRLKGSDLVLESLSGQKNKKTITANGLIAGRPGESFVNFEAKDIDVVGLGWDPQIESLFTSGKVSIAGRWAEKDGYKISGDLNGFADSTYSYGNGTFEAIGNDDSMRFAVDLKGGFSMSARGTYRGEELSFNAVDASLKNQGIFLGLSYLNKWKEKVDLQTTGALAFKYNGAGGSASFENLRLRRHDSSGQSSEILSIAGKKVLSWDKGGVRGEGFATTGASTLRVSPSENALSIDGKWSADLVDVLIPDFVRLRDGYAEGSLQLAVPFGLSSLRGNFHLHGISMGINGLGRYGQNTSGHLEFRDSRLLFKNLRSNFGTGVVQVNGEYKADWKNPGIYLNAELQNAEFLFVNEVPAVTSGSVVMSGNKYPFDVRGRVAITDGLYSAESSSSRNSGGSAQDPTLKFDIAVDLGSKFSVRNSLISTNVAGSMRLVGTDVKPMFVGVVQLENGRVFARDNEFKVLRGVVDFPPDSENVFINVTAATDIKTTNESYTVTLNASGTTEEPDIEFQSNPPLALPDIASLLAFGVVRSEETLDSANTSLADTARAEALQTIFGKTIGTSLRKKTGLDVRVSARAALSEEQQTIPKVTVVRKLSKKVTATFGRSLDFSRPENNAQIDYELLKNVNVSGVWEQPKPKESSIGFDLRFKWDVK